MTSHITCSFSQCQKKVDVVLQVYQKINISQKTVGDYQYVLKLLSKVYFHGNLPSQIFQTYILKIENMHGDTLLKQYPNSSFGETMIRIRLFYLLYLLPTHPSKKIIFVVVHAVHLVQIQHIWSMSLKCIEIGKLATD